MNIRYIPCPLYFLVVRHTPDPQLGVVSLGLQFQLNVQYGDQWFFVVFWLHLETGVTERLFERHTLDEPRIL